MRDPERRLGAPVARKNRKRAQCANDLRAQQLQPTPHQNQIGVVRDVRARRAVVNESLRGGSDVAERMHMRHDVVAKPLLVRRDDIEIEVVDVIAHLLDRVIGNRNAELFLRIGQ